MRRFQYNSFEDRRPNNWVDDLNSMISFINENGSKQENVQQIKIKDPDNALFLGDSKYGPIALDYSNIYNMRILTVGQSGSGKSYMARKLIEELQEKESIVFICDPEGEWATLRECYNFLLLGKTTENGQCDIEINKENIEKIIENCIKSKTSAIFRLNEWSDHSDRLELVTIINTYLLYKVPADVKYNNITIVYEEAHRFAPRGNAKNNDKITSASINSMKEFMSQSRRRKLSSILITQRPAKLHADIVSQCNVRFIGRMDQDADIRSLSEFLDLKPKQYHILKELNKEFITKGEYFFHHQQLPAGTLVTFQADKVRSPHLDLRDFIDWQIPPPRSELRDKINFITSQTSEQTAKVEPQTLQAAQNKNLDDLGRCVDAWLKPDAKIEKFEQIVSCLGTIKIRDLYVLAIENYNPVEAQFEITKWLRGNSRDYLQVEDEIYAKEIKNIKLEDSVWFLNKWMEKLEDNKYCELIEYLYNSNNSKNSLKEISTKLDITTKQLNDLYLKHVATGLLYAQETELYLNNIFFHSRLNKEESEDDLIESIEEDNFEDFDEMDSYSDD